MYLAEMARISRGSHPVRPRGLSGRPRTKDYISVRAQDVVNGTGIVHLAKLRSCTLAHGEQRTFGDVGQKNKSGHLRSMPASVNRLTRLFFVGELSVLINEPSRSQTFK